MTDSNSLKPVSVIFDETQQRHVRLDEDELGQVDAAVNSIREMLMSKQRRAGLIREAAVGVADPLVAATIWQVAEDQGLSPRGVIREILHAWAREQADEGLKFKAEREAEARDSELERVRAAAGLADEIRGAAGV